ncbi:MAG: urate oxidase [Frankiales bacterium]|jgi:urate oxidase|nr:urate oxidase [Frankiales bacterium]
MVKLGFNRYGKAEVRLVHVSRGTGPDGADAIRDWNISSSLSGELAAVHLSGDNSNVLATDSQKNTAYAFAQKLGGIEPEAFALALAEHFVTSQEAITRARLQIEEYAWNQLGAQPHSFARGGQQTRTTTVIYDQEQGVSVVGGVADLIVMNTTNSEFWGFPRDEYTTLPETKDRILATQVTASWRFREPLADAADYAQVYDAATSALLTTFAGTYSYSLQQMLYLMSEQILKAAPQLCEVRFVLPNKHHFLVDLEPFGLENDNEVYFAADRPYGLIEGQVSADDAPPEGLAWT